jgi:hypothetical protein
MEKKIFEEKQNAVHFTIKCFTMCGLFTRCAILYIVSQSQIIVLIKHLGYSGFQSAKNVQKKKM